MSSKRRDANFPNHAFRDVERLGHNVFPDESPVYLSHTIFPNSNDLAESLDLPLGFVTRPFIENRQPATNTNISMHAKDICRCCQCYAYINPYCDTNATRWYCSLCGRRNNFDRSHTRYKHIDHKYLPELREIMNDFRIPMTDSGSTSPVSALDRPLVHLFLIQEDMAIDSLQAVVDSISASIDAAHPEIHIGLMSFSHRLGLYSLHGNCLTPSVQLIHLVDKSSEALYEEILQQNLISAPVENMDTMVPLHEVVKFSKYITPLQEARVSMANSLNSLFESSANDSTEELRGRASSLAVTLVAIKRWIMGTPQNFSATADDSERESKLGIGPFDFSKIWQLLDTTDQNYSKNQCLTERNCYSGILLHAFFDSPQTLPTCFDLDCEIKELNDLNVNVNLWGICSFDSQELGLHEWESVARRTGGRIHRFSLGICPKDETVMLTETIRRTLTARYATNCDLKIRASPVLQFSSCNPSGLYHRISDHCNLGDTHDKLHIPVLGTDSSFGFSFIYDESQTPSNNSFEFSRYGDSRSAPALSIQVVFTYETLVSGEENEFEQLGDVPSSSQKSRNSKNHSGGNFREQCVDATSYLLDSLNILGLDLVSKDYLTRSEDQSFEKVRIEDVQRIIESKVHGPSTIRRIAPYNFKDKLVVVKHLRVFTVAIECSSKLNQILKSCDYVVATALIVKESLMAETVNRRYALGNEDTRHYDPHRLKKIQDIVTRIHSGGKKEQELVNAITRLVLVRMDYYYGSHNTENQNDGESHILEAENLVKAIFEQTSVSSSLLLLYTALIRLMGGLKSVIGEGKSSPLSVGETFTNSSVGIFKDSTISWINNLQMCNPYVVIRSLYPDLTGLGPSYDIVARSIDLRRDKMIESNSNHFLLDSVFELVSYRSLTSHYTKCPHRELVERTDETSQNVDIISSKESDEWKSQVKGCQGQRILEMLINRLYEHPIVPRLLMAEAGTASAGYFTSYFVEDSTNTPIDYNDFKLFILDIAKSVTKN